MRLLVVEDDPTIAEPLRRGLVREGFDVDLAGTGAQALAAGECDLVLLDLGLPDIDGRGRFVPRSPSRCKTLSCSPMYSR